jgi:hypothetical protein
MIINKVVVIYLFWIVSHYAAANLYATMCTPLTIKGFLLSPFYTSAPHCQALQWMTQHGSTSIHSMWVIIGSFCIEFLRR